MIRQVTEKSIGHRVKFHFLYSTYRELFFEVINKPSYVISLANYIMGVNNKTVYPIGVLALDTIVENKIFSVEFDERIITEEKVIEFAKTLGL